MNDLIKANSEIRIRLSIDANRFFRIAVRLLLLRQREEVNTLQKHEVKEEKMMLLYIYNKDASFLFKERFFETTLK